MKFFSLAILICCFSTFTVGNSVTMQCHYYMQRWWGTNSEYQYQCSVDNYEISFEERVFIEKAKGNHQSGKTNDDVKSFYIHGGNLKYFPKNLQNVFKNLELIFIANSKLIEITSEDLRPFPKLKYFYLDKNPIEIIKEDLFVHNLELEVLYLVNNKINHIEPKALSQLNKLRAIDLSNNVCKFDKTQAATKFEVLKIVKKIEQGQCLSLIYRTPENLLISQINQLKQQFYEQQDEILKFKKELNGKEQNMKKLTEENENYKKTIVEQEKQIKVQEMLIENCSEVNKGMKDKLKIFEEKNEELEKNVEKILKISEKQNLNLTNFYLKCNNDKVIEKLDKQDDKLQNGFKKLSTDQTKILANYEAFYNEFSIFTEELIKKEKELKVMNHSLEQCDAKLKEKLTKN
ncbi:hypothetical protein PVAND_009172 [Polypedilum vanderplanki]|uniref:Leucine rich repeat protein n=1 Tax=Polypedilum vanderplanki TaxID=319348 RepID=A0A9J6CBW0_POLVA|nr:hypothetical protein PVAND_009172 [Polypedilum vanderplanki]